eukprot:TRINITY_DN27975_c0_g1_i1.p1 TRINITY_DN27975_c0_g1~~TRINITY_DN27975_c0_g1_i1.p1  ORF type:complete len:142 (-),score=49.98 TRINITY_DN27975_c0_g1_i1:29-454(-)
MCIRDSTKYTPTTGTHALRSALSDHLVNTRGLNYASDEILISGGGKQSIYQAFMCTCSAGDEVIVVAPYWVSYVEQAKLAGATVVVVDTTADGGECKLTAEGLEKVLTKESRMLVLNNPCNPTGVVYSQRELEAILSLIHI